MTPLTIEEKIRAERMLLIHEGKVSEIADYFTTPFLGDKNNYRLVAVTVAKMLVELVKSGSLTHEQADKIMCL